MKNLIQDLKQQKNAIILAHNYQPIDVLEVADFMGDSFELAKKAQETDANIIVFAGVSFMAESAKILNPNKKVLLPSLKATCPMAGMVNKEKLSKLKEQYPNASFVCYINTLAETKAMCDYCVTSSNAVKICNKIESKEIVFLPDRNLAAHVQEKLPQRTIIPFNGYCYIHQYADKKVFENAKQKYPDAPLLLHPETPLALYEYADEVLSTGGMVEYAQKSNANVILIGTEEKMAERLKYEFPEKEFIPLLKRCSGMGEISLESIYESLKNEQHEISLISELMNQAKIPLERMMKMG